MARFGKSVDFAGCVILVIGGETMHLRSIAAVSICILTLAASVRATPLDFAVNQSQSNVNVQLCILGSCDSDPSSVSGFMSAKALPIGAASEVTLYDYFFHLNDQIDLFISFSILGNFTGTGQNISLLYAAPGLPQPPALIAVNSYTIPQVPSDKTGTFHYVATGIVCNALQSQVPPVPCNDTIDFATTGTSTGDIIGTIGVVGRTITLSINPNVNTPLDPDNPGTGTLSVTGTIVCVATAPLRGDANLNGSVDTLDIQEFTRVMTNPGGASSLKRFAVDMNDDDVFDDVDVTIFVDCLLGFGCPQ
jgi:hypothetical protein